MMNAQGLFSGRLSRTQYIGGMFALTILMVVTFFILSGFSVEGIESLQTNNHFWAVAFAGTVLSFSLHIRRFHDVGYTGWFSLLTVIPYLSIAVTVYLAVVAGQEEENEYGTPALEQPFWHALLGL